MEGISVGQCSYFRNRANRYNHRKPLFAGRYVRYEPGVHADTVGSTNYVITPATSSFTVTGNTNLPQAIIFAPPPNFASGGTYQLTARTTSGLPVSYTVTTGNASITGTTPTFSGAGLVTVQATQNDPTGDYAPATAVSRSFTAQ